MARIVTPLGSGDLEALPSATKTAIKEQKPLQEADKLRTAIPAAKPQTVKEEPASRMAVRMHLLNRNDPNARERLVGSRDIVSINFFERGLEVAKAICRIKILGRSATPPEYGTGFLITPSLLLTNNHVLPDAETAASSLAEFGYELYRNFVEKPGHIFPFAPSEVFFTSAELDFTVVAISPMGHDGTPISDFGALTLIPMSGKGVAGEDVSLIQHPSGGTKQVVVIENRIIKLDPQRFPNVSPDAIHYEADTEPGASGAAVFNDQWYLVAIHHLAVADRDTEGRALNRRGEIWTESEGDDAKRWVANERVCISAIWRHLQKAAAFDVDAAKIMAMLAFDPRTNHQPAPVTVADAEPKKWQTIPGTGEAPAFESTRFTDPGFADSIGYKPDFLGADLVVELPKTAPAFKGTLAVNTTTNGTIFDYTHFSLAMNAERRLALWTAVNIDGSQLKSTKSPSWRRDDRLLASEQTLAEIYGRAPGKGLQIDRGHLVRRLDPVWGDQPVADRAGDDTFHYPNAAPQEHVYNSEILGTLEDFVLARADKRSQKVSVMTGPVLRPRRRLLRCWDARRAMADPLVILEDRRLQTGGWHGFCHRLHRRTDVQYRAAVREHTLQSLYGRGSARVPATDRADRTAHGSRLRQAAQDGQNGNRRSDLHFCGAADPGRGRHHFLRHIHGPD
ncbi:DNA/RNA non-specific endonuclease [Rhizobium ruizarguesonis]|uniref:DNA/RNA non-specific endonuclease n=1 Tax=Rhizobium ruizarguesonis TaxID=2081791 RepID=UPI00163A6A6F|nr:DNA/RNA non-specific endonuclease [Rhizobium ruizarguesonis]MBC2806996.1 DNA/RNA non-specific endonuclease [Rhizobium ruizarguesonis]